MIRVVVGAAMLATSVANPAELPCAPHSAGDRLACVKAPSPPPPVVRPLSAPEKLRMRGVTWHAGCPVTLEDLSVVEVPYVDEEGAPHRGQLVIATTHAKRVGDVFVKLYEARFPIARIEPIEAFDGDDQRSMAANNTTGFNCRPGPHPGEWSRHAFGDAIDLNPLWNPQVREGKVSPEAAVRWANRSEVRPGMNMAGGTAVKAFREMGWRWGGLWPKPKDYQHFSATGR